MKKKKQMRNMIIGIAAVFVLAIAFALSVSKKQFKADETYVVINDREYTKQEFDYFFYGNVNDFYSTYGQFAAYMGLDITGDLSQQQFSEEQTWEEYFYDMTVELMKEHYALYTEAKANGFEYNTDTSFANLKMTMVSMAASYGVDKAEYYKECYGPFATEANVEPLAREVLYVNAYKEHLIAAEEVTDAEITETYEASKADYDYFDYRSFVMQAETTEDMTEEQKKVALDKAKEKAEEFMQRLEKGEKFNDLCLEYAPEEQKSVYENDGSLAERVNLSQVSNIFTEWLLDDSRKAGDVEIIDNEESSYYTIVMFEDRYFDDEGRNEIREELANAGVTEKITEMVETLSIVHKSR